MQISFGNSPAFGVILRLFPKHRKKVEDDPQIYPRLHFLARRRDYKRGYPRGWIQEVPG